MLDASWIECELLQALVALRPYMAFANKVTSFPACVTALVCAVRTHACMCLFVALVVLAESRLCRSPLEARN